MVKITDEQRQEAWRIAVELNKLGIKPKTEGQWTTFRPPPPTPLLMRILDLPDGLVTTIWPEAIKGTPK